MKNKDTRVTPRGIPVCFNCEAATAGAAEMIVNLREREHCLTAVGEPELLAQGYAGHRVLLRTDEHLFTATTTAVHVDGTPVAQCAAPILSAHEVGRFVVVETEGPRLLLCRRGDTWTALDPDDAVPLLRITATATRSHTATIAALTFATPYASWRAPLTTDDARAVHAATRQAWREAAQAAAAAGRYCGPVLVRYTVRLWDDTLLWVSAPVLLGGDLLAGHYRVSLEVDSTSAGFTGTQAATLSLASFGIEVETLRPVGDAWRGLVKQVDVLVTPAQSLVDEGTLDYRCVTTQQQGTRRYVLEAGLRPRTAGEVTAALLSSQWRQRDEASGARYSNAQLAPLTSSLPTRHLGCVATAFGGKLHEAPARQRWVNAWPLAASCHDVTRGVPCTATIAVRLVTEAGEDTLVASEQLPFTPQSLNALLAFPGVNATHMSVQVGSQRWEADLQPWHEAGMSLALNATLQPHAFAAATPDDTPPHQPEWDVSGFVTVSETGNPLVRRQLALTGGERVLAIVPARKPIYNGGFGRYPLYLFTTGGVLALSQQASGGYGDTRLVCDHILDPAVPPVAGDNTVWFMNNRQMLCRLSGAQATQVTRVLEVKQMAWCATERELWVRHSTNRVMVLMASGCIYGRTLHFTDIYSCPGHSVGIDVDGRLRNLLVERHDAPLMVYYRSCPIEVDSLMRNRLVFVQWNLVATDARLTLALDGARTPTPVLYVEPEWNLLNEYVICHLGAEGNITAPLPMRVPALPTRTVILAIEGTASTFTLQPWRLLSRRWG